MTFDCPYDGAQFKTLGGLRRHVVRSHPRSSAALMIRTPLPKRLRAAQTPEINLLDSEVKEAR